MTLPDNVQYACLHANGRHAYVACSDGAPGSGPRGRRHWLVAFQVAPGTGALHAARPPLALAERPIHIATDRPCAHLLVAFNNPAAVRVWRIAEDGTLGGEVEQPATLQPGIFPHQVCAAPDGRHVTVTARGNDATPERAEEPGRLSVFRLQDGVLQPHHVVAPQGGFGFGPRDAAFHPRRPWLYVSLERQNELAMLDWADAAPRVVHRRTTLADPGQRAGRQIAGAVQLHPRGQVVYVANRASETMTVASREVLVGGENSLAVFALDPDSGEPRLIQSVDTQGVHPRTFAIDPGGRMLVVAHIMGGTRRRGEGFAEVPGRLATFAIAADGTLTPARQLDLALGGRLMFWMGLFAAPPGE